MRMDVIYPLALQLDGIICPQPSVQKSFSAASSRFLSLQKDARQQGGSPLPTPYQQPESSQKSQQSDWLQIENRRCRIANHPRIRLRARPPYAACQDLDPTPTQFPDLLSHI